jgi:hypothetical protein
VLVCLARVARSMHSLIEARSVDVLLRTRTQGVFYLQDAVPHTCCLCLQRVCVSNVHWCSNKLRVLSFRCFNLKLFARYVVD